MFCSDFVLNFCQEFFLMQLTASHNQHTHPHTCQIIGRLWHKVSDQSLMVFNLLKNMPIILEDDRHKLGKLKCKAWIIYSLLKWTYQTTQVWDNYMPCQISWWDNSAYFRQLANPTWTSCHILIRKCTH
jgi:hypothetical protein